MGRSHQDVVKLWRIVTNPIFFKVSVHSNTMGCGGAIVALILLLPSFVHCTHFDFPAFGSLTEFLIQGGAHHELDNQLVNMNSGSSSEGQFTSKAHNAGRLQYKTEPVQMKDTKLDTVTSFSTSFTFSITQGEGTNRSGWQAHSSILAFMFSSQECYDQGMRNLNPTSGVGYWNPKTGIAYWKGLFAVEFDTFQNYLSDDPSNNHIGVDIHTLQSKYVHNLCGGGVNTCSFPWTGHLYTVWIEYNLASPLLFEMWFANGSLEKGVAKPSEPLIRVLKLELNDVFDEYMHVGFIADAGIHGDVSSILSWRFNSSFRANEVLDKTPSDTLFQKFLSKFKIIYIILGSIFVVFITAFLVRLKMQHRDIASNSILTMDCFFGPYTFSYEEIKKGTNNFDESFLLGSGGFGVVYKGTLRMNGTKKTVAIKKIMHVDFEQNKKTFLVEASSINQIRHRNLVQLHGWCNEAKHFILVFQYMSRGSLDEWLYPKRRRYPSDPKYKKYDGVLPWALRFSILAGIAAAIEYLHEDWVQCVLHRDIKSSNILLDDDFNPYLGDFGLARFIDHDKVEKTTLAGGTLGYIAPEVLYTGKATKESDVYSFGILILEVVCGRKPLQSGSTANEDVMLLHSVWRAHEGNNILSVVDLRLKMSLNLGESSKESMEIQEASMIYLLRLGLLCCLPNPEARPNMRLVKQLIIQKDDISVSYTPTSNQIPSLPLKMPINYFPLPGYDSQLFANNHKALNQDQSGLHQRHSKSQIARIHLGYDIP